ncbi:MAG: outer membrane beta-barrel protein [Xanthobacteraceae bacterium]|jgi:outer membrane immunogenic protein
MKRLGPGVTTLGMLAIAASVAAAPARAADLPTPASSYYPPAPAYAPALYDWTGFYTGGHLGADLLSDTNTQNGASTTAPATNLPSAIDNAKAGFIGGGQVGLNYQFAAWVVGAELSVSATNLSGSATGPTSANNTLRMTSAPMDFGAVTGRIGYAFNTLLPYVKAGVGSMQVHYTQDTLLAGTTATQEIKDTRTGFTGGFGVEYGLTESFSAKLEYDLYDFGTKNYNFAVTPVSIRSDLHVLEFGLNYRFNGGH